MPKGHLGGKGTPPGSWVTRFLGVERTERLVTTGSTSEVPHSWPIAEGTQAAVSHHILAFPVLST